MARVMEWTGSHGTRGARREEVIAVPRSPLYKAYQALHWGFTAVPVIAGLDKFANLMTRWEDYVAPQVSTFLQSHTPITTGQFMMGVGVVEILAGLLVAIRPRIGGAVVGLWLAAIIGNLLIGMHYFDIALRDLGLMVGAFALGYLGKHFDKAHKADEVVDEDGDVREIRTSRRSTGRFWRHRSDDMM
jgi:hypothetical protein